MNSSRYMEMYFDGEYFEIATSKRLNKPSDVIEDYINNYLKNNPLLIESSVLPRAQQYLLKKGLQDLWTEDINRNYLKDSFCFFIIIYEQDFNIS